MTAATSPSRIGAIGRTCAGPRLDIDLAAVAANTRLFAARTPAALMAVVKADGFGHGSVEVARTALAHGASWLGVTSLAEAESLRDAGLTAPVLSWLNSMDADWETAMRRRVDVAVPGLGHLTSVVRAAASTGLIARIHLHADTGMARDGAPPEEWDRMCRLAAVAQRDGWVRVVGVMGHLARADHGPDATGRAAFERFLASAWAAGVRAPVRHLAATSATLTDPAAHHDLCRVGAGLVGIDPSGTVRLRPALRLSAPVVAVRVVAPGTGVGYGHTHVTSHRTGLATLPLGYADGIPRAAAGRGEVLVHGRRCRIVGAVSMDQTTVDVGGLPVGLGDEVVVFGPGDEGEPTPADWADWAATIAHEIVTGIGPRVRRRWHTAPAAIVRSWA